MRRIVAGCLSVVVACSCASSTQRVRVERNGSSWRDGALGVAALIRTDSSVTRVPLTVAMYRGDQLVATERSTLPFCVPDTDCWWGESYTTAPSGVDRVDVSTGQATPSDRTHRIVAVPGRGHAPAAGTFYAIDEIPPLWGTSRAVDAGDRIEAGYLYVGADDDRGVPGAD